MSNLDGQWNYNCIVTTESGEQKKVYANWIHNNDLDHWQGWRCDVGYTNFFIDDKFNVWSGLCKNDLLGNIMTEWQVKSDTVCKRETCTGATGDLIATKYKPG